MDSLLSRDTGQRWHRWRNNSTFAAPPFAHLHITGTIAGDSTDIIFTADLPPVPSVPPLENLGVQWFSGFNCELPVEPGAEGYFTFDLPAWTIISDNVELAEFVTAGDPLGQRWSLSPIPDGNDFDEQYWSGFRVFATRFMPDWVAPWNARQPTFLQGIYKLGFVGGLTTYLTDFINIES